MKDVIKEILIDLFFWIILIAFIASLVYSYAG